MQAQCPTAGRERRLFPAAIWSICMTIATGCGSSPSGPGPTDAAATFTFTSTGVSPKEARVPFGSRVLFVNNDSQPHAVSSDPFNVHTDCPPVNEVGTLPPGQSRTTGRLQNIRTCGFHDHNNETDTRWAGRIIVE
jgi:hypothetical protein